MTSRALDSDAQWCCLPRAAPVYGYEGLISVGHDEKEMVRGDLVVLSKGHRVTVATAYAPARLIVVAGHH